MTNLVPARSAPHTHPAPNPHAGQLGTFEYFCDACCDYFRLEMSGAYLGECPDCAAEAMPILCVECNDWCIEADDVCWHCYGKFLLATPNELPDARRIYGCARIDAALKSARAFT